MAASEHPKSAGRAAAAQWQRHFQGWPLAAIAVGIGLLSLLLASPRPTVPDVLPLPELDVSTLQKWQRREQVLAEEARRTPLPRRVRAIGESYREFSHGKYLGLSGEREERQMRRRTKTAVSVGLEREVRRLRAVQTEFFLEALEAWTESGRSERELGELAGDFLNKADQSGWLEVRRPRFGPVELAALFQIRWTYLAGLLEHPRLKPELVVWRAYFTALLRQPEGTRRDARSAANRQLAYIEALGRHDPEYPRDFARGVLLFRTQRLADAEESFRVFLADPKNVRWRLRARNHWLECRERQGNL